VQGISEWSDTMSNLRPLWLARLGLCAALLAGVGMPPLSMAAPSCTFSSVTAVSFGTYDVFVTTPNNNGIGSLKILCSAGIPALVTLSSGQSHSYVSRVMKSGGNALNYNLYTSAARTVVWGDGTGGSATVAIRNSATTLNVFGKIPAAQDANVGLYSDNIVTTVNF
jgi:spore coat protein U-like protein